MLETVLLTFYLCRHGAEMSFTVFLTLLLLAGYLPTKSSTLNGARGSNYVSQASKGYNIAHNVMIARFFHNATTNSIAPPGSSRSVASSAQGPREAGHTLSDETRSKSTTSAVFPPVKHHSPLPAIAFYPLPATLLIFACLPSTTLSRFA
jgi:hypothetical protein